MGRRREPTASDHVGDGAPDHGLRQMALTTNGVLLSKARARALRAAGLDRITISLDGADGASVARMAGQGGGVPAGDALLEKVLAGIAHARSAGFDPDRGDLKLNAVITRHGNADQLLPLAALARRLGVELRLIEFMDVGNRNGWRENAVLSSAEMVERIGQRWPLEPLGRDPHGTAGRWRYRDGGGHLATVASISTPFCGDCNRLRVTADGMAFTCLFGTTGTDLRRWLRPLPDPVGLREGLAALWRDRKDRYSEERRGIGSEPGDRDSVAAPGMDSAEGEWQAGHAPLKSTRGSEAPQRNGSQSPAEMAYLGG